MPKYRALIVLVCFVLISCRRESTSQTELAVSMTVTPNPPQVGLTTIDLQVLDTSNQPVAGAQVEVEGSMTHAGMSTQSTIAKEFAPGRYRASVSLTMGGDWMITVLVQRADSRTIEVILPLPNVQ